MRWAGRDMGRMRWVLWLGALLLLALVAATLWRTVGQPRDRFWEHIEKTGQWRVGLDPSFPPFEQLDGAGQPVGFDVDLARAIADRWGVQATFESIGFDGLIDAVWASKVDSVISAMPLQPQFGEDVTFSQPYFEAGLVVVVPAAGDAPTSLEDLAGRLVAVEWGSEGDVQARALRRRLPTLQVLPLDTPQAAVQAVAEGQAQAAFVDNVSAQQAIASSRSLRLLEGEQGPLVLASDPYVVVMPRKAPVLHARVGEALEALAADGTLEALARKWFGAASSPAGD